MRIRRLLTFSLVAIPATITGMMMEADWRPIDWKGESAWVSHHGEDQAVVSADRGRLVYFGRTGDTHNLLYETETAAPYREGEAYPDWGGHRFWLGPQKNWTWPPLPDWEYGAAEAVRAEFGRLVLTMMDSTDRYPALTREYFWKEGRLGCRVSWSGTDIPYYGMHIFAVPSSTLVVAEPIPTAHVSLGLVQVLFESPDVLVALPPGASKDESGRLELRPADEAIKLGFPSQVLEGRSGERALMVSPAEVEGRVIHPPDSGFLTQVWVCPEGGAFIELEQISPYLLPDRETASSLVFIEVVTGSKEP